MTVHRGWKNQPRHFLLRNDIIIQNQRQLTASRCQVQELLCKAALRENRIAEVIAAEYTVKLRSSLRLFHQLPVDGDSDGLGVVFAFAQEKLSVLLIHGGHVDLCITVGVVEPIFEGVKSSFPALHSSAKILRQIGS